MHASPMMSGTALLTASALNYLCKRKPSVSSVCKARSGNKAYIVGLLPTGVY